MVSKEVKFPIVYRILYSYVFVNLLRISFHIISMFDSKVSRGIEGRRGLFLKLKENLDKIDKSKKRIWFHVSSLGEFEQAKPVIELLKEKGYAVIVSFFSPSGYDYSLNYKYADVITYLPLDLPRLAKRFVELVKADVLVVMRYDLWMNHVTEAKKGGTKVILADATFPTKILRQPVFLKRFYRILYSLPDLIITTSADQKKIFDYFLQDGNTIVGGDTRFDRVLDRSEKAAREFNFPYVNELRKKKVVVLGSTWHEDIEVIGRALKKLLEKYSDLVLVIVPHEPTSREINSIREEFPGCAVFSEIKESPNLNVRVIIVDSVGILSKIYSTANIAYVGGGFGAGVHNVLEPAVYGIPIVTGPRIENSNEAVELLQIGALFYVNSARSAYKVFLRLLSDESFLNDTGRIAGQFVRSRLGASKIVVTEIEKYAFSNS
ncbi:MAG: 3-deoxy-D-manno-octulosonic acid transferase [Candidatus Kryptoniota bacterium]